MNLETNKQKGFTLIELMIVIAIIGILASIAIPQFSQFRIKAFNAASISDLHGLRLSEEAVYTDYQNYGVSAPKGILTNVTAIGTAAAGVLIVGNTASGAGYIALGIAGAASPITISRDVVALASADALYINTAATVALFANVQAVHSKGNKIYAAETDQQGTYQKGIAEGTVAITAVTAATGLEFIAANGWLVL